MGATAFLGWFAKGAVPAVLLLINGLAAVMPKQFGFLENKLAFISYKTLVGIISIIAAVGVFMKW